VKYFSSAAFERLLFPLHKNIYRGIDNAFIDIENKYPGSIEYLASLFDLVYDTASTESITIPEKKRIYGLPIFDIYIDIGEKDFNKLRKTQNYATFIKQQDDSYAGKGIHLIVSLNSGTRRSAFIIPIQLVMRSFEDRVCKPGSYLVYEHTLIRKRESNQKAMSREDYLVGAASYVGITKRSWQERYKEHTYASRRGSQLLFHKALRGELFTVDTYEHQVLRAGLNVKAALRVEEIEVEE
jgi:hypothetical protein